MRNFAKFTRKHLCRNLFFDKVRRCRSTTLLKTRLKRRCFLVNFAKFVRTLFLQSTTGCLFLIIAVSIVVKGELVNETVNYETEIKVYQFEPEVQVIKKGSSGERTGLTRVFEEGVLKKN